MKTASTLARNWFLRRPASGRSPFLISQLLMVISGRVTHLLGLVEKALFSRRIVLYGRGATYVCVGTPELAHESSNEVD